MVFCFGLNLWSKNIMIENIAHQEKRWVLYLHTVSKELSGYDHDKYYVGISSNLKRR